MSCCGRRREALRKPEVRWARGASAAPSPPGSAGLASAAAGARVEVRFTGRGPFLVAGPASREVYRFSAETPRGLVDARDVAGLLRTGLFAAAER
jgi:hypothetical protein